ncbi:MAG TPA: hypothetical protein VGZ02_10565 [Candidatus Baltobacteraceae bacterium]|nr:hypothetical protein [Candidatus Baltobacteraceae bacterium]
MDERRCSFCARTSDVPELCSFDPFDFLNRNADYGTESGGANLAALYHPIHVRRGHAPSHNEV